jgi:hypothetical protein
MKNLSILWSSAAWRRFGPILLLLFVLCFSASAQVGTPRVKAGTPPVKCKPGSGDVYIDTTVTPPDFVQCLANDKFEPLAAGKVNAQTGTSYTFLLRDRGKLVTFNNGSAVAVTLPQATSSGSFLSGWSTHVFNLGAGTATITPTTSTINGSATLAIAQNEGAVIFSDGTNYSALKTISTTSGGTVTPSSSDTFTNKTYDAEGTGNVLTQSFKTWFPAAGCNNTTAASFWDLPTSTPAVAACVTGSNTQKGVLQFADTSGGFSAQNSMLLPADFSGTVDALIIWRSSATSGNAKFSLSTICTAVNASETDDPSFNTASTVTTAAAGTANRLQSSAITTLTITGCAAGEFMHLKLFRDGNDGSDTLGASLDVIGVELTTRRAQ